LADID
jgi:hypothetical protein